MAEITKTIPAYNPADVNTLSGLNNLLQDKMAMQIECAIPGIVLNYNRLTNRATVKPAITGVASQGQKVSKEPLIDVPVFCMSGNGIVMSFPIKPGDTGWLIANDRNISIFKQSLSESAPNDYRKHTFVDAFFFPDKINSIDIENEDDEAYVIQCLSHTAKFTLEEDKIKLVTDSGDTSIVLEGDKIDVKTKTQSNDIQTLNVDADNDINVTSTTLDVTASATTTLTSPSVGITGTVTVTGETTSDGLADTTAATGQFLSADDKLIIVVQGIVKQIRSAS